MEGLQQEGLLQELHQRRVYGFDLDQWSPIATEEAMLGSSF